MFIPENPSSYGKVLEKQLPYAFPIKVVVLKKAVTKTHMAINIQFTSGMYTCPINFGEVWMTFTVGKQPSASDCSMIENVADIIAWLAMMAANVAATLAKRQVLLYQNTQSFRMGLIDLNYPNVFLFERCVLSRLFTWDRLVKCLTNMFWMLQKVSSLSDVGSQQGRIDHAHKC